MKDQKPISGTYSQLYEIAQKKRKEESKPVEKKMEVSPPPEIKPVEKKISKPKKVEKRERQLNAWISSGQNEMLNRLYFQIRAKGIRVKKGELVGVAIEILSRILEKLDSRKIDSSALDRYIENKSKA